MKKLQSLWLLLLLFSSTVQAQSKLDSLYGVWEDETMYDSVRADAFVHYVWGAYLYSNPDTAFILAQSLLQFGEERQNRAVLISAFGLMATTCYYKSDYTKAIGYYERTLELCEETGSKKAIAVAIQNIGNLYMSQGNYVKSLDYFQRSLMISEEIGYEELAATSIGNIGNIYLSQKDYTKALDYFKRCLTINEEIGDKKQVALACANIGTVYGTQKNQAIALEYFFRSLKLFEEVGYSQGSSYVVQNIGNIYLENGDHPNAMVYYQRSLEMAEEVGDKWNSATAMTNIGLVYKDQGDYAKALEYCQNALVINQEMAVIDQERDACQCLYDTYKLMGNTSKALEYHEKLTVLNDSLFNEDNTKKLTQLEMQYEFDKQEAAAHLEQEKKDAIAVQELKRQKLVRNGFMGGFAVVLVFAGIFFVQRNRIGKEKERSEELLLNILPEETAQELKEKGHSDAQLIDHVTVLFTDFKGFTALSEKVTPKELVADLHDCFSQFDYICEKYGIEKIKTIGDAYMAAGGLPSPNITHAMDVVRAALEMREIVENGKRKKIEMGLPFFEIRIGVHTGPVVAGIVGVKKFQYDIWGDTVNTASRMESSGEVGKVNISQTTYELLKSESQFSFKSRGKIQAKGKGELEMYFVSKA